MLAARQRLASAAQYTSVTTRATRSISSIKFTPGASAVASVIRENSLTAQARRNLRKAKPSRIEQKPYDPSVPPNALTVPPVHRPTHGIPVALIHFRSHSPELLSLFIHFTLHVAYAFDIPASRAASLPTKRSLFTVLRGPFAHKKSQENFEKVTHKRAIKIWDTDAEVLGKFIRYLEVNALGGVGMRIIRWERAEIGFGRKQIYAIMQEQDALLKHKKSVSLTSRQRMQEVADQIVATEMKAAAAASVHLSEEEASSRDVELLGEQLKKFFDVHSEVLARMTSQELDANVGVSSPPSESKPEESESSVSSPETPQNSATTSQTFDTSSSEVASVPSTSDAAPTADHTSSIPHPLQASESPAEEMPTPSLDTTSQTPSPTETTTTKPQESEVLIETLLDGPSAQTIIPSPEIPAGTSTPVPQTEPLVVPETTQTATGSGAPAVVASTDAEVNAPTVTSSSIEKSGEVAVGKKDDDDSSKDRAN